MISKKMIGIFTVFCLIFLIALSGCGSKQSATTEVAQKSKEQQPANVQTPAKEQPTTAPVVKVSLGMSKYTSGAPLYVAMEKGFFKEFNLDVEAKWFTSANDMNVAAAGNSLDVYGTALTASLYNQIAAGAKISVVADKGKEQKGFHYVALMVPKDSNIKTVEDLKGKRSGVSTIGSSDQYVAGRIIANHGLSLNDIQWVPLGSVTAQFQALQGKQVDMVKLTEPDVSKAVNNGFGRVLVWAADEIPYQTAAIMFSQKFADNKDVAVRFLAGYLKGLRYYNDAVLVPKDGQYVKGPNYDEVVKIIAKFTDQKEEAIKEGLVFFDKTGNLDVDDIQKQINWYFENKFITKQLDVKKDVVKTELLEEATKLLSK